VSPDLSSVKGAGQKACRGRVRDVLGCQILPKLLGVQVPLGGQPAVQAPEK
jgi:hypothetical protein